MSATLIDLDSLEPYSLPASYIRRDTLEDMNLLQEEAPPVFTANKDVNSAEIEATLSSNLDNMALPGTPVTSCHVVSSHAPIQLPPTLTTRSSEAVIADLKRGRNSGHPPCSLAEPIPDDIQTASELTFTTGDQLYDPEEESEEVDSEGGEEVLQNAKPRKISERKRIQNAVFDSWYQNFAKQQVKGTPITSDNEETRSTRWLVKQGESQRIISSPREYQVELFERAKAGNIIAVLDTGSGKTLIAVLLLRHIIEQELADRAIGNPKRVSFFLVDSVQLIFQQFAVLECNLSQPMDRFCGQMGCDLWSREKWQKVFSENMVIVCTAEVLRNCLHHSFISMDRINLLIFDEAHHAKKDHPYSRIIKDFYIQEDDMSKRPKIFGMTASPVDTRLDVDKSAAELEAILHCQIATASDPSLLQYNNKSKSEMIAAFEPLKPPFETPLFRQMHNKLEKNRLFRKLLINAKEASSELGAWCSDHSWQSALTEEERKRSEAKTERKFAAQGIAKPLEIFEAQITELREAQEIVKAHVFLEPEPTLDHLSTKVLQLMKELHTQYKRADNCKCIIFVRKRHTARILAELFTHQNIGTPYLHVGYLIGGSQADVGDLKVSFRQQVITLMKFRKGLLNCLFATSVAEEGLDIPDCNLVIRFDLCSTLIQYIQSRGRARQVNSRYIHMMESGNRADAASIKEVVENEDILRKFCQSLPAERLLCGNDFDMDHFLAKEKTHRIYKEPTTGAILNYKMSLIVLANFVASLPHSGETALTPEYFVMAQNKQFICEVILPETSPVRGAVGRPASTKQVAKCSAAFDVCLMLRKGNYLDSFLLSTYVKQLPVMRNAHLAVNSKKQEAYKMRTKPQLWSVGGIPEALFLTVFTLTDPGNLSRPCQPLGLLTRSALPTMPEFALFFGEGRQSLVITQPVIKVLEVNTKELALINEFTLRIFFDVFSKEYETDPSRMPYFLVPVQSSALVTDQSLPSNLIEWEVLKEVNEQAELYWDEEKAEDFFVNKYIVDPHDGSRKFWSTGITHDYKPLDPVPSNTAPRQGARKNNDNIMEYSCSLWVKSRARRKFREDQPVFEAEYIPLRRNLLDECNMVNSETPKRCYLIPEPLKISTLPTTIVAMAYLFPSIIHRVESYLIALEACSLLHLDIRPDLALEALTKDSDNSEEHGELQIQFQRGMGKNYERLEFLGDCFLKMATSISLYTQHPTNDEYEYHVKRMLMICNQNLLNNALELKLYEYIRSQPFNRRAWYPEGLVLKKGKTATAPKTHNLGDKTIADVCEALIGAALLANTETYNFDNAVRAVTELVCSTDHTMTSYQDYYKSYSKPKYQTAQTTASQRDLAMQIEQKHSYHFKYPRLLRSAFVHPSYPFSYEHVPCYQRLEFLGDSLLDMVCINHLFHQFPDEDPQWLTEHKMAMVSNQFLGALCVSLGFYRHLLQFSSIIQKQISDYVTEITEARIEAEDEAVKAGKKKEDYSPDYWVHTKHPPKCLPDMIEAYIGAIFVDSEYQFSEVELFFKKHIQPYFTNMTLYDTFANKHPVTFLTNLLTIHLGCSDWNIYARQLADIGDGMAPAVVATVMVHNRVIVDHQSTSGRYAKMSAAKKALEMLAGLPLMDFRVNYHCDCKLNEAVTDEVQSGEVVDS